MTQELKLIIKGIDAYDGEYDFPFDLTNGEWHTIKRLTGLRRGEVVDALTSDDTDLPLAYAVIALQRAGKYVDEEILWGADPDAFDTNGKVGNKEDEEETKLPPATGAVSPSGGAEKTSDSTTSGGSDSETSQTGQNGTGQDSSEPSHISGQPI